MSPPCVFNIIVLALFATGHLVSGREIIEEDYETSSNQYDFDFINLGKQCYIDMICKCNLLFFIIYFFCQLFILHKPATKQVMHNVVRLAKSKPLTSVIAIMPIVIHLCCVPVHIDISQMNVKH